MDNYKLYDKSLVIQNEDDLGYLVTKRIVDFLGAAIGIIVLSPVMLIAAVAIKLNSRGPIIFSQERVGVHGKVFRMYKFRSMVVDAENHLKELQSRNEMSGPMFKIKDDPRITKVGRFIRKTSIDELPQLFNVLIGNMSLVGPRPNLAREVVRFTEHQKEKLNVKPGITCYWQVMGRNNIDFEEWIELDIKYIRERNIWLDLTLILKTFFVLFGDENAR
ncbi:MAG: sugar transferase [Clostridiales bacterium]|nr:sugar transferase [Clostridiales bacterium]